MFKEDTLCLLLKNWWKHKPEDELYYKLQENPCWPFKQIGDGYYLVIVQSDRAAYGLWFFVASVIGHVLCTWLLGWYALTQTFFIISYLFCIWTLWGRMAWRELIISRRGKGSYMLRVLPNQEKLIHHDLRNVYIRLTRKDDTSGDPYFWLNLSGYELDDYRITRMTKAEDALRIMGMRLAYRLGVNFFDWRAESENHLVFHYKTYTKLQYHPEALHQGIPKGRDHPSRDLDSGSDHDHERHKEQKHPKKSGKASTFLDVPSRRRKLSSTNDIDVSKVKTRKKSVSKSSMDDGRRKVKIKD